MRCGRYYQFNTFHLALEYAADVEAKKECKDAERDIRDVLRTYEMMLDEYGARLSMRLSASLHHAERFHATND